MIANAANETKRSDPTHTKKVKPLTGTQKSECRNDLGMDWFAPEKGVKLPIPTADQTVGQKPI